MRNLIESKILSGEMDIEENTPRKTDSVEDSHVDFMNKKYKNTKVFVTKKLNQLKEFLAKNEMLAKIPSKKLEISSHYYYNVVEGKTILNFGILHFFKKKIKKEKH